MFADILLSLVFAGIITASLCHMPLFFKRLVNWCPAWLAAALIHFGYGGWIGGVTGHMLGAMVSIPMYFLWKHYLQPKFRGELNAAWERNWFNRLVWRHVSAGWARFEAWGREWFVPQSFREEVACEA